MEMWSIGGGLEVLAARIGIVKGEGVMVKWRDD